MRCKNPKLLACRWQLHRAGLVCTAWSGAVYVAWRPDLLQLCPGKETLSPVWLDSLDIRRRQWKTGTLQNHVGGGGACRRRARGLWWVRNKVVYIILVPQGHDICRVWWARLSETEWRWSRFSFSTRLQSLRCSTCLEDVLEFLTNS